MQDETEIVLRATVDDDSIQRLAERIIELLDQSTPDDAARARRLAASRHALFRGQQLPEDAGLLIDTREVAELLNVSEKLFMKGIGKRQCRGQFVSGGQNAGEPKKLGHGLPNAVCRDRSGLGPSPTKSLKQGRTLDLPALPCDYKNGLPNLG